MLHSLSSPRALLVGLKVPAVSAGEFATSLEELDELSRSAGCTVIARETQTRHDPDVKFFLGSGKIAEIKEQYAEKCDVIIFNHELSPSQIRNVEKATGFSAFTRTEVILNIFALHATTKASKLQVEMARLTYEMPRIIGKGIEMSRIQGGIGMKGLGEQQLELDRRKIRARIAGIRDELEKVERERANQRKRRLYNENRIAIIGYTNSGKSTLLNQLTHAKAIAKDKLFATLDTTTRKLWLSADCQAVVTDTVGFIRDIPHGLIESFKSTFEDALNANLMIHVIDLSAPDHAVRRRVVEETILQMSSEAHRILVCYNKIDQVSEQELKLVTIENPDAVFISAKERIGLDGLKGKIAEILANCA